MRAFLMRLFCWEPSQFIYSARRVVFADGEQRDYENGSSVVSHAKRAKRRTA